MNRPQTWKERRRKLIKDYGFQLIQTIERLIERYSLVGNEPFLDPGRFSWVDPLEANWQTIRRELDDVLDHRAALPNFQDISKDQVSITTDDKWKTFFLYGFGFKSEQNCARCPETTRLIEQVPGMTTAFFSILGPGKHIPPHRGPYKGVLRVHLGLLVPEPREACRIRVVDQIAHWEEGKSIVFDDTFEHEVWNDTDGERVVLFMDVLRPLPPLMDVLNRLIIKAVALSPYIQDARKNQQQWERQLEDVMPAVARA